MHFKIPLYVEVEIWKENMETGKYLGVHHSHLVRRMVTQISWKQWI